MSFRDTRVYICNCCGKKKEGILKREKTPNGEVYFDIPSGWTLIDGSPNRHHCAFCTALLSEMKRKSEGDQNEH